MENKIQKLESEKSGLECKNTELQRIITQNKQLSDDQINVTSDEKDTACSENMYLRKERKELKKNLQKRNIILESGRNA